MSRYFKQSIVAACVFAIVSGHAFSEEVRDPVKNMEISVNPLMLAVGYLPLALRVALTNKMALGIHAYGNFFGFGKAKVWGAGGGLSAKFFLSGTAISDSWYVEPGIYAGYSNWDNTKYWSLSPSVIVGHTWVWDSGFVINLGLGAQYKHAFTDKKIFGDTFGLSGILPTGEFSLGWAW